MNSWNKKTIIAVIAVCLTLLTSTGVCLAYFSDYETAMGEVTLNLSGQTQIHEDVTDLQKDIRIVNAGQAGDANVVVRVAVYGPDEMTVTTEDSHWKHASGSEYYYYDTVLKPGEETGSLIADISNVPVTGNMPQLDVIVSHESAIAVYDADNMVKCPDGWNAKEFPAIKAK